MNRPYGNRNARASPKLTIFGMVNPRGQGDLPPMRLRISQIRREQGLSQEDLAERVHMSAANVSRIENQLQTKTIERLQLFADALGVSVLDLFELGPEDEQRRRLLALIDRLHPDDLEAAQRVLRGLSTAGPL